MKTKINGRLTAYQLLKSYSLQGYFESLKDSGVNVNHNRYQSLTGKAGSIRLIKNNNHENSQLDATSYKKSNPTG